jgi:hypothetical protein
MRLISITWASDVALLVEATGKLGADLVTWTTVDLEVPEKLEQCIESLAGADLILLHLTHEFEWGEVLGSADEGVPVVVFGRDPSLWTLPTIPLRVVSRASEYYDRGGSVF